MAAAFPAYEVEGRGDEVGPHVGCPRAERELERPLGRVVVREVRVPVPVRGEQPAVTPPRRVHARPRVVTEGHDAGGGLDRVGEALDRARRRPRRSPLSTCTRSTGGG